MNESWKWRSGRERERQSFCGPSGRGGKTLRTFSDDERVAAEHDGDVVMPAGKSSTFVVVQAELALEILVGALDAPAIFYRSYESAQRGLARQRREIELRGCGLTVGPFDDEPDILALGRDDAVIMEGNDAQAGEARTQRLLGANTPGAATEGFAWQLRCDISDGEGVTRAALDGVQAPNLERAIDRNGVVEIELTYLLAEPCIGPIGRVGEHHARRQLVGDGALDHVDGQLGLGFELHTVGNARFCAAGGVVGPTVRQIQLEVRWADGRSGWRG